MNNNPYRFKTHQRNLKKKDYDYNKRFNTENNNDDIINNINNNINFGGDNLLRASDNIFQNNNDIHINDDLNDYLKKDVFENDFNKQKNKININDKDIFHQRYNVQNEIQTKKRINEMMMKKGCTRKLSRSRFYALRAEILEES